MLRIFADDVQSALALDDLALRTALANGGAYFHDYDLLNLGALTKALIILVLLASVQFQGFSAADHGTVRRRGSPSVTATECSKCAVRDLSAETTVHLLDKTRVWWVPTSTIGSRAIVMPFPP